MKWDTEGWVEAPYALAEVLDGWIDLTRGRLRAMCPFYLKNSKCQHLQAFSLGLLNLCRESSNLMTGEKGHIMLACRHCGNQQKKKVEEGWPHGSACRLQFIRLVLERHLTHAFLSLAHCAWSILLIWAIGNLQIFRGRLWTTHHMWDGDSR